MGVNTMGGGSSHKTFIKTFSNNLVLEYDKREDLEKKVEEMGLNPELIIVRKKAKGKNEGKEIYYYILFDISGKLTDVSLRDTDWGEMLELEISDVDDKYLVSMGEVFGVLSKDFIRRLGNIDMGKDITLGTWSMVSDKNGKTYSGVKIYQDNTKIEYNLANTDLPMGVQKTRGGKTTWDFGEQEDFLYKIIGDWIKAEFSSDSDNKVNDTEKTNKPLRAKFVSVNEGSEQKDDLPF